MRIIIVGCGRVGSALALSLSRKDHAVVVIDARAEAFDQLTADFTGRTLQGSGIDRDVLERAGISEAEAFAAATASDNVNIVAGRIAQDIFHVPNVVARTYNPHRLPIYERLGLQTVASSSWGALRFEELMTSPRCASRLSLGNGNVEIVEIHIPAGWIGQPMGGLRLAPALPVAVTRGGQAQLPDADFTLQAGDLLYLAVHTADMPRVNAVLAQGDR